MMLILVRQTKIILKDFSSKTDFSPGKYEIVGPLVFKMSKKIDLNNYKTIRTTYTIVFFDDFLIGKQRTKCL